ncbi:MAG: PAS domain-containing protein [Gammaproteobacteria bacterium]
MAQDIATGLSDRTIKFFEHVNPMRLLAASLFLLSPNGWSQESLAPVHGDGSFDTLITALPAVLIAAVALISAIRAHYAARAKQRELEQSRKAQTMLAAKESALRTIVENCAAGLWQIDGTGRTVYLNPAMASLLQIESNDDLASLDSENLLIKHSHEDDFAKPEYLATIVGRHGRQQKVLVFEAPVGNKDHDSVGLLRSVMMLAQQDESGGRNAAEAGGDTRKPRQATISPIPLRPAAQA